MSRKILLVLCLILSTIFCTAQNKEQEGLVKTRGRLDSDGKVIPGVVISDASIILKGGNSTVSDKKGEFSILLPSDNFYLQNVQKEGYVVVDQDVLSKQYSYSRNPLVLTMETPTQQLKDKIETTKIIRESLKMQLQEKQDEIERLKNEMKISEEEYLQSFQKLLDEQTENEKLISEMAERYSKIDFDQLDDFYRTVSRYILNGELTKADSMLNSRGNIDSDIESLNQLKDANAKERADLTKRQKKLEKSEAIAQHQLEELALRCYSKYEIFKMQHQNDSALCYLEKRASLDTTNVEWMMEVGEFASECIGNNRFAIGYFESAIYYATLDDNYNQLLECYNSIGSSYLDIAEYDSTLIYVSKAMELCNSLRNQKLNVGNISDTYLLESSLNYKKSQFEEALINIQKSLDFVLETNDYKRIIGCYNNLGIICQTMGDYSKAMMYFMETLDLIKTAEQDEYNYETVLLYNNIASLYIHIGDKDNSLNYFNQALQLASVFLSKNHPFIAMCYNNIGYVYQQIGNIQQSIDYFDNAINIYINIYGEEHPNTLVLYNNQGNNYMKIGDYDNSLFYLNKALDINLKRSGEYDVNTAMFYNSIGAIYTSMKEYDEALEYFKKALNIRENIFGKVHDDVANSYGNIGMIYHYLGDDNKCLEYHLMSLNIRRQIFGDNSPHIALASMNIAQDYINLNDNNNALKYFHNALDIAEKCFDDLNHPMIINIKEKITELNSQINSN